MTAFKFNFSTHMRAFKINFSKLFSPHILLRRAGQESWRVDRSSFIQYINCAKFSYVGIVMLCGVVHTAQALWWGEGKYRRLDLTFYKTDKQYQPPILKKTATRIEKNSHPYWENMFCRLTSQHRTVHEMCPGNTKTEMGRNTVWKMQYCELTNWRWRTDKLEAELNLF